MALITNTKGISLPLAVWLLSDDYDYDPDPNVISATSLLRPIKQLVLSSRVPYDNRVIDVSDFINSRTGSAFHDAIERSWLSPKAKVALKKLGYPDSQIARFVVNPDHWSKDEIPIFLEKRTKKPLGNYIISGKFDMVIDGALKDFKSTSTYTYTKDTKSEDYILQGSIYRWLNPDIIKSNTIGINFLFTDWQKNFALSNQDYPASKILEKEYDLLSLDETEKYIKKRIELFDKYKDSPEEDIPPCTDKELWRGETVYKYYSDPLKTDGRATKNFDSLNDANKHRADKGKGVVLTVPGQVKACLYCSAFSICKQKDQYDFT